MDVGQKEVVAVGAAVSKEVITCSAVVTEALTEPRLCVLGLGTQVH